MLQVIKFDNDKDIELHVKTGLKSLQKLMIFEENIPPNEINFVAAKKKTSIRAH